MFKKYVSPYKWTEATWNFNRCHDSNIAEVEKSFDPLALVVGRCFLASMNSKEHLSNFDRRIK